MGSEQPRSRLTKMGRAVNVRPIPIFVTPLKSNGNHVLGLRAFLAFDDRELHFLAFV